MKDEMKQEQCKSQMGSLEEGIKKKIIAIALPECTPTPHLSDLEPSQTPSGLRSIISPASQQTPELETLCNFTEVTQLINKKLGIATLLSGSQSPHP